MDIQSRKTVIIGAGHVGSHAGFALAAMGLCEEIVYIDVVESKAKAQAADISDAVVYLQRRTIVRAGDYSDAQDAALVIIAAGPLPDADRMVDRQETLHATVDVLKDILPKLRESSFYGIILSISNPADVVAHYIQHWLKYPSYKVFSTSTTLDSARLRRVLSEKLCMDQKSIAAYVLGEHGESQIVPWSVATVAGKPLLELMREQPEKYGKLNLDEIAQATKSMGWNILLGKGSTEFGIGSAIAEVARAIFANENRILPVSVLLQGEYGQNGVYASVPAVINNRGISEVIELSLNEEEMEAFAKSCASMKKHFERSLTM